jgi:hypothetical protein
VTSKPTRAPDSQILEMSSSRIRKNPAHVQLEFVKNFGDSRPTNSFEECRIVNVIYIWQPIKPSNFSPYKYIAMSKNKRTINITNAVQQLYINRQKRAWNDDAAKHGAHENRKKHEACENAQKNTRRVKNHKYES